jgi:hypothetical protein
MDGFRRLDNFVRTIERRHAPEANFEKVITYEREISSSLDGRTVFDHRDCSKGKGRQLDLFSDQQPR